MLKTHNQTETCDYCRYFLFADQEHPFTRCHVLAGDPPPLELDYDPWEATAERLKANPWAICITCHRDRGRASETYKAIDERRQQEILAPIDRVLRAKRYGKVPTSIQDKSH